MEPRSEKRRVIGRPFGPGNNANPTGRPKSNLSKLLSRYMLGKDGSKERGQVLVEKLYALAKSGDMDAVKYIYERLEGKPQQPVDVTSGDKPMSFTLNLGGEGGK